MKNMGIIILILVTMSICFIGCSSTKVYPIGLNRQSNGEAIAYVVRDGEVWYIKDNHASKIDFGK